MKRFPVHFVLLFILLGAMIGCNGKRNREDTVRLMQIDSVLQQNPKQAVDSLQKFNSKDLSRFNRGYYYLLDVISKDKTYYTFTSDSTINAAVRILSKYKTKQPRTYARSLMYKGIVRYRMGITDSTAYIPLKEAVEIFVKTFSTDRLSEYLCYYYLGEIQDQNKNIELSNKYYLKSLIIAEQLNDLSDRFYSSRGLYWNYLKLKKTNEAKIYLDKINSLKGLNKDQEFDRLSDNAQYYYTIGNFAKALEIDLKIYQTYKEKNDSINALKSAYRLVDDYSKNNQLDHAMFYAQKMLTFIQDSAKTENYLCYIRAAEIAEQLQNYKLSTDYYKKANRLFYQVNKKKLDTKILELEKKYDLTQSENNALKFKNRTILFGVIILILLLVLAIVLIIWRQRKIKDVGKRLMMEQENRILQNEKTEAERMLLEKNLILPLYAKIASRNQKMKILLEELMNEDIIANKIKLFNKINSEYHLFTKAMDLSDSPFITDEQFYYFTKLTPEQCCNLSKKEKMLLIFIAIKLDNQQIAVLLNTSVDSVRVYRSRLKKKIRGNNIRLEI